MSEFLCVLFGHECFCLVSFGLVRSWGVLRGLVNRSEAKRDACR